MWVSISCQEGEILGMQKIFGVTFLKQPNFVPILWNRLRA